MFYKRTVVFHKRQVFIVSLILLTSKEETQELFEPLIKDFKNINGLTHKLEYDG